MKRWFIHYKDSENNWRKIFRMCLTYSEASYNIDLLQKNDKLQGTYRVYRIVCINVKPMSINQLKLAI